MSSVSMSSIQSESNVYSQAAVQLQDKIGIQLKSPFANAIIKQIGYAFPTSSPEDELFTLGKSEIRQLKRGQAFGSPQQQVLDSYREILHFIKDNKKEIDSLRKLHSISVDAYGELLDKCNLQQRDVVKFLTNLDKPAGRYHAEELEILLDDELPETSQPSEDFSSNTKEASAAVAHGNNRGDSSSIAPYETISDENAKPDVSVRARRSGSIVNMPFEYREQQILEAFDEISWTKPEDRIQRLIVSISQRKLSEQECVELMKMLHVYESIEKEWVLATDLKNMKCNDYFHRIAYKGGRPFLIPEGSGLPGAVNDLRWQGILYYENCGSSHPTRVRTDEFLARVEKDVEERQANRPILSVRRGILAQMYGEN